LSQHNQATKEAMGQPATADRKMRQTTTTHLSSMYEVQSEQPINLDISKFISEPQKQSSPTSDLDIINESLK